MKTLKKLFGFLGKIFSFFKKSKKEITYQNVLEIPLRLVTLKTLILKINIIEYKSTEKLPCLPQHEKQQLLPESTFKQVLSEIKLSFTKDVEKQEVWKTQALRILETLQTKNVIFVADTGRGKTPIAFLSLITLILIKKWRILFLAPTQELISQHSRYFNAITKKTAFCIPNVVIHSKIPKKQVSWDAPLVFTTPQTAQNKLEEIMKFQLVISDECHLITGNHAYAVIIKELKKKNVLSLNLSALPAENEIKLKELQRNIGKHEIITYYAKSPLKLEENIWIEPDETLKKVIENFSILLQRREEEVFKKFGIDFQNFEGRKRRKIHQWKPLPAKAFRNIKAKILKRKSAHKKEEFKRLMFLLGQYGTILAWYNKCILEGYKTFQIRMGEIRDDKKNFWRYKALLSDKLLRETIWLLWNKKHPKQERFKEFIKTRPEGGTYIIFVGERKTGEQIFEWMKSQGMQAGFIAGQKTEKHMPESIDIDKWEMHEEISKVNKKEKIGLLKKLEERTINFLIATSVIKLGVHVPNVNGIIEYTPPDTGIARKQGEARTGRVDDSVGHIYRFVLNEILHTRTYYRTKKVEKKMMAYFYGNIKKDGNQTSLFH